MSLSNFQLPGYHPIEQLYCDSKIVVYRAQPTDLESAETAQTVVIKVLFSEYPAYQDLLNFRHQYTIAKNLDLPGVVRTYSLETYHHGYALVMEDFGGRSLTEYRQNQPLSCPDVLNIAIQLADTLHELGQQRIVHKDIKPANILINPTTKQVKLIDFSIASLLPRETQSILSPSLLEGTLAYISPEQTGRMNRGIDYRTDFYALGVTLYELLLGKLPFETEDFTELIYCHLAQQATPIDRVNPDLPAVLSQIVAKLMAKNAEDRYQSALGIKYDLKQCLHQYQLTGKIKPFNLGSRDLCDRFLIPEHLYGRAAEVQTLLEGFTRVSQGQTELMLVAGFSGIGKTAVVNEVHKPITRQHGYFVKGKYDQFNRNIPLSAFVQAFRDLIGQLLSESDVQLASWKSQILLAVGENGRVLIEAIPELELIIGAQLTITQLSGTAAQNRFNMLFQKFIEIFTTPDHPLVIFLDDLQWADLASLQLIKLLMGGKGYLLLLGAYRDNEVSPIHPLMLMVQELQQAQVIVRTITLTPLGFKDINQLTADTLHCSTDRSQPLAKLINIKTQGNPFFTTQFLKVLHSDGEIWFNRDGYWECDITRVESLSLTDDVAEFMSLQLLKLPSTTQEIFKLAACIGNQFDLNTLAIVSEQSQLNAAADLWNGLQSGLILPNSQIYKFWQSEASQQIESNLNVNVTYRFLHDRVQQAAYSLISEDRKPATHLKIGRLLYSQTSNLPKSDRLLEIVNQFNAGASIIDNPIEQQSLMQINLFAARKARANTAYHIAFEYSLQGIKYLFDCPWENQYKWALDLHEIAAETAQLINDSRFNTYINIILERATDPLDRCGVYRIKMTDLIGADRLSEAIDLGIVVLAELGIYLSKYVNKFTALSELIKTEAILIGKNPCLIKNRQTISNPKIREIMNFLDTLVSISYLLYPDLFVVIAAKLVQLSERHGNCEYSSTGYAVYSFILASAFNQIDRGIQYNRAAIDILEKISNNRVKSSVFFISSAIKTWDISLQATIDMQHQGYEAGIEVGNFEYAAWNLMNESFFRYLAGENLDIIYLHIRNNRQIIISLNQDVPFLFNNRVGQSIDILLNNFSESLEFKGTFFDDLVFINKCHESGYITGITHLNIEKLIIYYIFGDLDKSIELNQKCLETIHTIKGHFINCIFNFYSALTMLATNSNRYKKQISICQKQVGMVAKYAPMNARNKWELIEAERLRQCGKNHLAIKFYDLAISSAKVNGFIQEEALANELAAKFYLAWEKEKIATVYMQEAYYAYARWGATAKTNDLKQRYPQLLTPILQIQQQEINPLSTLTTITNSRLRNSHSIQSIDTIDLASVIQSAQVLSSTLDINQLIQELVEIILKNSGAETCILALPVSTSSIINNPDNMWQIQAIATVNSDSISVDRTHRPLVNNLECPAKLMCWIKNTQQTVIFDARQRLLLDKFGGSTIEDRYLCEHQPQSVFALPIVKQESVIGVLYLEHRHAPDIFTLDKKTIVSFLCSQAAIALENSRIYQQSQQIEIVLRQSQARYQKLSDNIPGVIYQFQLTPNGEFTFPYISSGCYELFEIEAAVVINDNSILIDTIHPDDLAEFQRIVAESAQNMTPKLWEGRVVLSSGTIKWIKSASRPERQLEGSIVWDGVMLDITDRVKAELDLVKSQQKYYNLIQSINGVVWEYDLTIDRFSFVSDRAVALFGYPISDWLSQSNFWQSHIYPEDLEKTLKIYDEAIENHRSCEFEYRLITADGRVIWVYDISTIICDLDGNSIATNGLFIDISDLKQVETELQQANERLELTNSQLQQATRLKDEFLATMSHELRTPLNAILGMSESLQEEVFGTLNPRQIKSISTIEKSGQHLLALINDILDVSKIAAGKLALNITEVSLRDLCESSLVFIKQKAFEKQIQIDTHFSANLDKIFVDERRMRQVLINLLNNAVKFTPNGGLVTLAISVKSPALCHQTAGYSLCFDISDTGIGIAKDDIAKLFQPFIQVDGNLNRKYQGTGLGLVLVKQIVELHGGSVSISSEVDKGSCFNIVLPQTNLNSLGESLDSHPNKLSHSVIPVDASTAPLILLAEDNELNINTFSSYLMAKGYRVIVANNGNEAIALSQSHQPDLILMDVQMPDLDGITAIEYIRQQSIQIQPPIIALTALAMPGDREKCLAAGANKYLTKPLKLRELHQTIQECLDLN
jgi:PAS domain S-box-containing protein